MMRSLFSGVSGLKAHQTRMDVIGNNIANVNTTSYKSMSINFSDLMYQTTQAATGPNATTGTAGTNPKQIGLGVQTAAISTKITEEGATQSTGNPFDLKIAGDEFFVVSNGVDTFFTRDGSFYVDASGNLAMSSTGYNVMGWGVDENTMNIKKDTVKPLVIMGPDNETFAAEYTQKATASGIVDWNDSDQSEDSGKLMSLQIYDNLGYSYTARFKLHNGQEGKGTDNYTFYTELDSIIDSNGKNILEGKEDKVTFGTTQPVKVNETKNLAVDLNTTSTGAYAQISVTDSLGNITTASVLVYSETGTNSVFNSSGLNSNLQGAIVSGGPLDDKQIFQALFGSGVSLDEVRTATFDTTTKQMTIKEKIIDQGIVISFDGGTGKFSAVQGGGGSDTKTAKLGLKGLGAAFADIEIDFSQTLVSDNKGKSTIGIEKGDAKGLQAGRALGTLQGVSIQTNGMIYASYSNGQQKLLGQIAVAEFANPSGLQKEGENVYSATQNSGDFDGIGIDITVNGDKMNTGVLEMSNVDLSSEFTDMITTQRGFQANSRIITVSDTLLEELTNLKR